MDACATVGLRSLMSRTAGIREVTIGLIDGPVAVGHPDLAGAALSFVPGYSGDCRCPENHPCIHATFVAGILSAHRDSAAPGICPDCTLLVRPVFDDCSTSGGVTPSEVATAIVDCINAGARILSMSSALSGPLMSSQPELTAALNRAARAGVLVVAAAGNTPTVSATALTAHPWVIPVAGCDAAGRAIQLSTIGRSIGARGLSAPAQGVRSIAPNGKVLTLNGTSFAAPFVTGAAALLWSLFPSAPASALKLALLGSVRRTSVVPPLLDAERAYRFLQRSSFVRQAI